MLGYISAAVMTHTARNGLGLVHMVAVASKILQSNWCDLLRKTLVIPTKVAWTAIADFYHQQLSRDNIQYGYQWARIIDHGFFRGLSPKEHPLLATIMASVIEEVQGPGVCEADWYKNSRKDKQVAVTMGKALYEICATKLETLEGGEETNTVIRLTPKYNGSPTLGVGKHKSLYMASIDVAKAFDSVTHRTTIDTLRYAGVPSLMIEYIADTYERFQTRLRYDN